MFGAVIGFSLKNRFLVLLACALVGAAGIFSVGRIPLDAVPDTSDPQIIVYTAWPGQSPQRVEDQLTYPLTSVLLAVPGARTVRGYSFFGYSFVHVIFQDHVTPESARNEVGQTLERARRSLPAGVAPSLGPDASGAGWAFIYSLNSQNHDLAELRSLQDWFLSRELSSVPGVAEVASVGGHVKQYQITVDPLRLQARGLTLQQVATAVRESSGEVGGRSLELGDREYVIRVTGYLTGLDELGKIAVPLGAAGPSVRLLEVADIVEGADMRRGSADSNGLGETVSGIVVVRRGEDVRAVIGAVRLKLASVAQQFPAGISYTIDYDRTALINRAVDTLRRKLLEEAFVVGLVCALFLLHLRSAAIGVAVLGVSILAALALLHWLGFSANIMSLGGIAIAVGTMVDATIIMIENAHKHFERDSGRKPSVRIIRAACAEVGPTVFFSLALISVSFLPVFALQSEEGRLFTPLALTKTFSIAAAAVFSVTLAPVLMTFCLRGRMHREASSPLNRLAIAAYTPVFHGTLRHPRLVLGSAVALFAWVFFPWNQVVVRQLPNGPLKAAAAVLNPIFPFQSLGSEFMPPLAEGDLLYMPTMLPGIAPSRAREILQQTDAVIRSFPEVQNVWGKVGRADTATDPAPMEMIETTIRLLPQAEWPRVDIAGPHGSVNAHRQRTTEELTEALDAALSFPGLRNAWTMPIRGRIDMLATGIKTPLGLKIAGPNLEELERIGRQAEVALRALPGTHSVVAERALTGGYLEIEPDRDALARHGLTLAEFQATVEAATAGTQVGTVVSGRERYDVTLRYARDFRDNIEAVSDILVPVRTGLGALPVIPQCSSVKGLMPQVPLKQLARVKVVSGPMSIKSEGAIPNIWVYIDAPDVDPGSYLQGARHALKAATDAGEIMVPSGYSISWSGEFEAMERSSARLRWAVPLTLLLIVGLLQLNTKSLVKTGIVLLAVPFSLIGAFVMIYALDYNLSVAVWIGIISLAGIDAETGVVMLLYLDLACDDAGRSGRLYSPAALKNAIYQGAVARVRPKLMTASVILMGLLPILWSSGTGADIMKRIAAPMVGGVITSTLLELLVYPLLYYIWRSRALGNSAQAPARSFEYRGALS
jgi:Cu(I)/Ag(I) efflux system membrane protein CusA/SilA